MTSRKVFTTILVALLAAVVAACSGQPQTASLLEPSAAAGGSSSPAPTTEAPRIGTMATVVDIPISIVNADGNVGTWNWVGQSVTMPSGASFSSIRFAWYGYRDRGGLPNATAFGRLYVLDRPYFGLPLELSASTPGFLARSEEEPSGWNNQGDEYELPESLTLSGGTQYWFYTDAQGSFAGSFDQDVYAGGQMFVTGYFKQPFRASQASGRMVNGVFIPAPPNVTIDANFRLRGIAR